MTTKIENNQISGNDMYTLSFHEGGYPGPWTRVTFKFDGPLEIKPGAKQAVTVVEVRRESIETL